MCGITGGSGTAADGTLARVHALNDAQLHRGPDHRIVTQVGRFILGNTRLAIQDPGPSGNQPFVSEDGRYHCVFNGEIYNYRQLVDRFSLNVRTACDGEVIAQLWAKLGVAALAELRGMFAIAIVDAWQDILYLSRDPFGIKPLYWRTMPSGFLFSSEVKTLGRLAGSLSIDQGAVAQYLHLGAMRADQSPFVGINVLPPNSVAAFRPDGRVVVETILPHGPLGAPRERESLKSALEDSIALHLGADVPTALLLSGGVDSATIAAVSHRLGRQLECLTVVTGGTADESQGAAETASRYGHNLRRVPSSLRPHDMESFFAAMQRPSIDGLNTYLVCAAVREAGFKVALSGLGGDEATGGYAHFRLLRYLPLLRKLSVFPGPAKATVAAMLGQARVANRAKLKALLAADGPRDGWGLSRLQRQLFPAALVTGLTGSTSHTVSPEADLIRSAFSDPFSIMVEAEVSLYLQSMLLPDADAFSMASSVELRVPFVDSNIFAASLSKASGTGGPTGKHALGAALGDAYLQRLAAQPKRGFEVPMRQWMRGPLAPVLKAAYHPEAPIWSVLDRTAAQRAGLTALGSRDRWSESWAIAALNGWLLSIVGQAVGEAPGGAF